MKVLILAAVLAACSLVKAEPEPKETDEQFATSMGFRVDLAVVEAGLVPQEKAISPLFERLQEIDPGTASHIAKFWRVRARVHLTPFIDSESRRMRDTSKDIEKASARFQKDVETAIQSYYFDSWADIERMILTKCEEAENRKNPIPPGPEAQKRYLEYLRKLRDEQVAGGKTDKPANAQPQEGKRQIQTDEEAAKERAKRDGP